MTGMVSGGDKDGIARELRDAELDRASGGTTPSPPPPPHEPTKHPAKVTVPDIKLG